MRAWADEVTGDGLAIDTIEALRERNRSGKNLKLGEWGGSRCIYHQDGKYRKCERKASFWYWVWDPNESSNWWVGNWIQRSRAEETYLGWKYKLATCNTSLVTYLSQVGKSWPLSLGHLSWMPVGHPPAPVQWLSSSAVLMRMGTDAGWQFLPRGPG